MSDGDATPPSAAKRFAAALSKARCEDAEPEPVKGTPRTSHMACSSPFSALPPCRPSTSTRLSALARSSACAKGMPRLSGRNTSSNGRLWPSSSAFVTSCAVSAMSQNHRSASGSASHSACAEATDTSRSLLVPPKRMVLRIDMPISFFFVIPGWRAAPDPESIAQQFRGSPMCNCTSVVRADARPGTTLLGNANPLDFPMQLYTGIRLHSLAHGFAQRFNVMAGGVTGVDQEVAVHFRHLRAADAQAPAAGSIDQLPGAVAGRVLERGAAGLFTNRLRCPTMLLILGHPFTKGFGG